MAKPPDPLPPDVRAAFERREPIQAIRLLLAHHARAAPQNRRRPGPAAGAPGTAARGSEEPGMAARGLSPGEVPRSGSTFWGWVVVALVAYLAYRFVRG